MNPIVAVLLVVIAAMLVYGYRRAVAEGQTEYPEYAASFRVMGDGFTKLRAAMIETAEAFSEFGRTMNRWIDEELAAMTEPQRAAYAELVSNGAYKLDALVQARKS